MDIRLGPIESFEMLLRYLFLVLEGVYTMLAFLMVRQVRLMNASFKTTKAPIFLLLARVHFLAAIIVLLVSLVLLL